MSITSSIVEQSECHVDLAIDVALDYGCLVGDDVVASILVYLGRVSSDTVVVVVVCCIARGIVVRPLVG